MALGFLGAFIWAMRTGQQDDLYTPSLRILTDEEPLEGSTREPKPTARTLTAITSNSVL
jgi:cbb3-type cytochrome oxidase maturation protein